MAKYECRVCGYIYNEQHASRSFSELTECPICNEGKENFVALDEDNKPIEEAKPEEEPFLYEELKPEEEPFLYEELKPEEEPFLYEEVKPESLYEEVKEEAGKPQETEETSEFVVERRQEFWTPVSTMEKKEESQNLTGWTISNAMGAVETILGEVPSGEQPAKEEEADTNREEQDDVNAYASRIESFYSYAEPVGTAHVISEEEEEGFTPLWNSGGGTVQRVIDPFGDKNDTVVKAENIGMVMPAEEPIVEEILGEEPEEAETEEREAFVETMTEENEDYSETEESLAEEKTADDAQAHETENEEPIETEKFMDLNDELDDDDEFFTEMTLDAVAEDAFAEDTFADEHHEREGVSVSEEEVFQAIDAIVFEEEVPEGGRIEIITADGKEIVPMSEEEETPEEQTDSEEAVAEEVVSEFFVAEGMKSEEITPEEAVTEGMESEEVTLEEAVAEGMKSEEITPEEAVTEKMESEESIQKAPVIKAWSFLDDVVEAAGSNSGVTYVTKPMDEVVEDEVTDDDIEEVFVDFANDADKIAFEHTATETEEGKAFKQFMKAESAESEYCNHLEKILIMPAQLSPMPLPEGTKVEGKKVLGIAAARPLLLENPVFAAGEHNMVQYIPNSGLTSEDYQKAEAIEIIVGRGNGIEKNINSKEDLRQVVNFLRLESDGCPIGIKLGAARIERDLEFCVFAKPDYVVLNNFDVVPLPYALYRATKYLNTVQSDLDIVIALDGAKDAEELAKVIAMGADVVALRNRPENMDEMMHELKECARITGHYEVGDLNMEDLCTTDREIAEFTDIAHV